MGHFCTDVQPDITKPTRHFQFTAYADVDTYVDTYADLIYRVRVSIFSND